MRSIILALAFIGTFSVPVFAQPYPPPSPPPLTALALQRDAKPVQHLASRVQARRGFHIPPLPPPLHFPGTDPTPAPTPVPDLATFLATVAIPDLQNAAALANAQTPPDLTAMQCWNGLIPIVQQIQAELPATNGSTPFGAATAVQIARDFINAPTSPIIKQVNLSCAALYMDTKVGLVNFATQFAGIFATGAVLSPIKPLPIP